MDLENRPMIVKVQNHEILIDAFYLGWFKAFHWVPVRKQKSVYFRTWIPGKPLGRWHYLHRLIAGNPFGKVVHHLDHNSLNNTRQNLIPMDPSAHEAHHRDNRCSIKFLAFSKEKPGHVQNPTLLPGRN